MLTGKKHLLLLLGGLIFTSCALSEGTDDDKEPKEAWWVSYEFNPTENNIYGIPISNVNPNWKQVSIFDMKYFERRLSDTQLKNIRESNLVYTEEVNPDGTKEIETFLVGVYETKSGQRGRFIAIKRDSRILKYFAHSGFSGYSAIYQKNGEVRWYKCMECNDYDSIRWSGSDYTIQ